jgi:uncharacterized protein (TIGR03435 family)
MKRMAMALSVAGWILGNLYGQQAPAPAFEVASVRPAEPGQTSPGQGDKGPRGKHRVHVTPGNVVIRNVGIDDIISWAYEAPFYQLKGPAWMRDTRFDIIAKAAGPATEDEMRVMMQTLLANRFKLTIHREDKEMPGLVLLVANGGPKLKESADQGESTFEPVQKKKAIHFGHMTLHEFCDMLSEPMDKPIVDQTGLKGIYDFTLDATNYDMPNEPGQPQANNDVYLITRVLPEQTGLRLEARKLAISMVIVDHLEKTPAEN